ncbi:phage portal protein [Pararhodospirillum photometricum]|uniref:Portal protein-like protein n=1 Tax=Pararhodospirillum photometricum DSM 122 TaxID=1150469 RepID=H6SQ76_PARPM|nr:phage portal protein [Pararhodospirillum photometricum]CCG09595.1 Portal protein-like protein [Pararhodospirillum photometricum DSM 122]
MRWFGRGKKETRGWGELERLILAANETAAGISVSPDSALEYAPVLAAVRLISESVAMLPVHLYESDGGDKRRADDHPLERLMTRLPNPWTTAFQMKADLTAALLLDGEAFALVIRGRDGSVIEVTPLPRGSVSVETLEDLAPQYRVSLASGEQRILGPGEVLHLRGLGTLPNKGLSLVHQGRHAIGLGMALERHASTLMAKGARPGGVLEVPGMLSPEALGRIKAGMAQGHGGSASGGTLVLENGTKYNPLTWNSVDIQFQEMRTFQVAEVSRIFRVPLSLLSEMSRVTHANAESLGQQFLSLTLLPYLRLWTETIYRDLLKPQEQERYYAEFTTGALEMADLAGRVDAYVKAIGGGLMTPSEARQRENLPPVAGGDVLRVPLNTESIGGANA